MSSKLLSPYGPTVNNDAADLAELDTPNCRTGSPACLPFSHAHALSHIPIYCPADHAVSLLVCYYAVSGCA